MLKASDTSECQDGEEGGATTREHLKTNIESVIYQIEGEVCN